MEYTIRKNQQYFEQPNMDQIKVEIVKPSLAFTVHKDVEHNLWYFGHPTDTYFGSTVFF